MTYAHPIECRTIKPTTALLDGSKAALTPAVCQIRSPNDGKRMRDVKQVPTVESTAVLRMMVARDVVRAIGIGMAMKN